MDELAAPVEELEPPTDEVADVLLNDDEMLDMTEDRIELMLERSALLVMVVTGTNDELTLFTDVMTEDEAEVVEVDGSAGVVLTVVGLLVVEEAVVLTTSPLLVDVTVTPLTVTVVGTVTLAVEIVTVVLPATVVVTVGAVYAEVKQEHAADTAGTARPTLAAEAKTAKSRSARSSRMARSSSSRTWTCSLR